MEEGDRKEEMKKIAFIKTLDRGICHSVPSSPTKKEDLQENFSLLVQVQEMEQYLREYKIVIDVFESRNQDLVAEKVRLEEICTEKISELEDFRELLKVTRQMNEDLESKNRELRENLHMNQIEISKLSRRNLMLSRESEKNKTIRSRLDEITDSYRKLQYHNECLEHENDRLKKRGQQKNQMVTTLKSVAGKYSEQHLQVSSLKRSCDQLKQTFNRKKRNYKSQIEILKAELSFETERYTKLENEQKEIDEHHQSETCHLNETINELKMSLEESQIKNEELENMISEIKKEKMMKVEDVREEEIQKFVRSLEDSMSREEKEALILKQLVREEDSEVENEIAKFGIKMLRSTFKFIGQMPQRFL